MLNFSKKLETLENIRNFLLQKPFKHKKTPLGFTYNLFTCPKKKRPFRRAGFYPAN